MKLPRISPVIGLAAITGCTALPEGATHPDSEQSEHIGTLVMITEESTPFVKAAIESMDGHWVDARGPVDSPEPMIHAVDDAQRALQYYWKNDKIFVGPSETMYNEENGVGAHSPGDLTPTEYSDNHIILNSDEESAWGPELLAHEAAHCFAYHDMTVEQELLTLKDVSYANPEFARIVSKHADFSYMQSGMYSGPSSLLVTLKHYREEKREEASVLLDSERPQSAVQMLEEAYAMEDKDEWVMKQAQWITSWNAFYGEFGVTTEMLADILSENNYYEKEQERRKEILNEVAKEISEQRRETLREFQSPFDGTKLQ
jgi:hypothetical protein